MRSASVSDMRRTEFDRLVSGEFGASYGSWIVQTHVLSRRGVTSEQAIEDGVEVRQVWWELCEDFDVPEDRVLGEDVEGF